MGKKVGEDGVERTSYLITAHGTVTYRVWVADDEEPIDVFTAQEEKDHDIVDEATHDWSSEEEEY
jgi:hypothetical protein